MPWSSDSAAHNVQYQGIGLPAPHFDNSGRLEGLPSWGTAASYEVRYSPGQIQPYWSVMKQFLAIFLSLAIPMSLIASEKGLCTRI